MPNYRYGEVEAEDQVGVVTGLAWTEVGGELLTIEGVMMPGKGSMTVTGNLRDVMKESISAAASYVRSRAIDFGIEPPLFDKRDIHVHVPEGATPEGRPVGRRRHGDGDRLGDDRHSGPQGRRHDRRDHAARPGAADRRPEGEAARGAARRHQDGADPGGERQGSGGDPRQREEAGWRSCRCRAWTRCSSTRSSRKPEPIDWDEEAAKLAEAARPAEPAVEEDGSGLTAH